jgi:hypothetical protein
LSQKFRYSIDADDRTPAGDGGDVDSSGANPIPDIRKQTPFTCSRAGDTKLIISHSDARLATNALR